MKISIPQNQEPYLVNQKKPNVLTNMHVICYRKTGYDQTRNQRQNGLNNSMKKTSIGKQSTRPL